MKKPCRESWLRPKRNGTPAPFIWPRTLYFKSSYERYSAMGKMIRIPVNIGMMVTGLEYH